MTLEQDRTPAEPTGPATSAKGLRIRVLVPLTLTIAVLVAAIVWMFVRDSRRHRAEDIARAATLVDDMWHAQLSESVALMDALMPRIMSDPRLVAGLKERDRERLLAISQPILEQLRASNRITHFYFILPDRTMLLRVQHPEEWGDRIDRLVLQEAQHTGRPTAGNEQGPFGTLTLRVVHPWSAGGQLIGFLELGQEFEDLMQRIHTLLDVEVFVSVDKRLFDRQKWNRRQQKLGAAVDWDEFPSVIVLSRTRPIPAPLSAYLAARRGPHRQHSFEVAWEGRVSQALVLPFADVRGQPLGELVVLRDVTAAMADARRSIAVTLVASALTGGALVGFFYVLLGRVQRDVADRSARLAEAQRLAAAREAASRAKSAFLANMSHELRSPLNAIQGFTRLVGRQPGLSPQAQDDLGVISRAGEHLHTLIDRVLDLSKVEAGRATLHEAPLDLYQLLDDLEDVFALQAQDKGLRLAFERSLDVPHHIEGDLVKLRQVLSNLLGNAIKFTHEGSVTLRVDRPSAPGPAPARLTFAVSDTGPGIAPEELDTVFDAFTQAQAGRQAKEGAGLGLAISRGFVRLMGGEMRLQSSIGQGTTASFDMPLHEAGAVPASADVWPPRVVALAPDQPRRRILVVDDREVGRQHLVRLFAPLGFELREAENGQEAVDACAQWQPHLVWMDLRMPVMDGREAARRIKSTEAGRAIAIIALTTSSSDEDGAEVLADGCDDYLRRPFRESDLFALMEKHLGLRFLYEAEGGSAPTASPGGLPASALVSLPGSLRTQLEQALLHLDTEGVHDAIREVQVRDESLARALDALARDFQYGRILRWLQGTPGERVASRPPL